MKIPSHFLMLSIVSILASCGTNPDGSTVMGTAESPMWHKTASIDVKVAYFGPQCEAFGHKAGTAAYGACLERLMSQSLTAARLRDSGPSTYASPSYNAPQTTDLLGDYYDRKERMDQAEDRRQKMLCRSNPNLYFC